MGGLISLISKGFRLVFGKPASFTSGECFENYARKHLFTPSRYDILQKTHNYRSKQHSYVPSRDPDFKFRDRNNGKTFYVEAKYRKVFFKGQVTWCTEKQLSHYKLRNLEAPVFILMGVGGEPAKPSFVALIPLHQINFITLYKSFVERYSITVSERVSSKLLWKRLSSKT